MIFESEEDLKREKKAIETFVNVFNGSYKKLDQFDIDFKLLDENKKVIGYAEVKGRIKNMSDAYPLPIAIRKISKLVDKRLNPIIIWACEDGIIYGRPDKLKGVIQYGGRPNREGALNDSELMAYYNKQKDLKYIRYK
jgi:hypothetical protein